MRWGLVPAWWSKPLKELRLAMRTLYACKELGHRYLPSRFLYLIHLRLARKRHHSGRSGRVLHERFNPKPNFDSVTLPRL
jgi:hypothetical protein